MNRSYEQLIEPVIKLIKPAHIVEVGIKSGDNTKKLLSYCMEREVKLSAIDPAPEFDINEFKNRYSKFRFYKDISLNSLKKITDADVILIDGDHNYYTVYNELQLIQLIYRDKFPVIFFHDVSWPYARRDLYYNPDVIPKSEINSYDKKGLHIEREELVEGGFNSHLNNAEIENTPKNGVLTAIEDFLEETSLNLHFEKINYKNGIGLMCLDDKIKLISCFNKLINNKQLTETMEYEYNKVVTNYSIYKSNKEKQLKKTNKNLYKETNENSLLRSLLDNKESKIENLSQIKGKLQEKVISKDEEIHKLNNDVSNLQKKVISKDEEIHKLSNVASDLQEKVISKDEEMHKLNYVVSNSQEKVTSKNEIINKLNIEIQEKEQQIYKLKEQVLTKDGNNSKLNTTIRNINSEIGKKSLEFNNLQKNYLVSEKVHQKVNGFISENRTLEALSLLYEYTRYIEGLRDEKIFDLDLPIIPSKFERYFSYIKIIIHGGLKKAKRLKLDIKLIKESILFDVNYYLLNNPDVYYSRINPYIHYLYFGGLEGRNPSDKFNSIAYLDTNSDVKNEGYNPLVHYLRYGKLEGRSVMSAVTPKLQIEKSTEIISYNKPSILYVVHSWSGGVPNTSIDLINNVIDKYNCYLLIPHSDKKIVLYEMVDNSRTQIKECILEKDWTGFDSDREDYKAFYNKILDTYNFDIIHIRHLIRHSYDLPKIANKRGVPVVLSFHDFYYVCPTINLLNEKDDFCYGDCNNSGKCKPHHAQFNNALKQKEFINEWREKSLELFDNCDYFITTDRSAKDIYDHAFPNYFNDRNFKIIEHGRDFNIKGSQEDFISIPDNNKIKILILGNIGKHKGLNYIKEIKNYDKDNIIEFHFLGGIESTLKNFGIVHGVYKRDDLTEKLKKIRPSFIGIFSIWAETYCHTLTEAWAHYIPTITTNIDAQKSRTIKSGNGVIVDYKSPKDAYDTIISFVQDRQKYIKLMRNVNTEMIESCKTMARKYINIYDKLLNKNLIHNQSSLRIGYILWNFPTFSQTFIISEIKYLIESGYSVKVYYKNEPDKVATLDFEVESYKIKDYNQLTQLLLKHEINYMHTHFVYPTATLLVYPASKKTDIDYTIAAHALDIFHFDNMKKNKVAEISYDISCKQIFTDSKFHKEFLVNDGVKEDKISIIKQSMNIDVLDRKEIAMNFEKRKRNSKIKIICVARFIEKKGIEYLIEASKDLEPSEFQVDIYGYGLLENEYRKLIEKYKLNHVKIRHAIEDKNDYIKILSNSDLFVLPCTRAKNGDMDGIPTVFMESMALGTPVLATNVSGISDIIIDNETGFLVEDRNTEQISNCINEFKSMSDEEKLSIIYNAATFIKSNVGTSKTVSSYLDVWHNNEVTFFMVTYCQDDEAFRNFIEIFRRLNKFNNRQYRIIIIDNASYLPMKKYLLNIVSRYKNIEVVLQDENTFCGNASNTALNLINTSYAIYICSNEGFILKEGFDQKMVDFMKNNKDVAIAGTYAYSPSYYNGQTYINLPNFKDFRNQKFAYNNKNREFNHIQGGFYILDMNVYKKVGGFNKKICHNGMDVEYSYYLESLGYKLGNINNVISCTKRTLPTAFSRLTENIYAIHPLTLDEVERAEEVVNNNKHVCPNCYSLLKIQQDKCECGMDKKNREIFRFISLSNYGYRGVLTHIECKGINDSYFTKRVIKLANKDISELLITDKKHNEYQLLYNYEDIYVYRR